jgi:hypothetical protein
MKTFLLAAGLLLAATPAAAVQYTYLELSNDNYADVVSAQLGKLEVDLAFYEFSQITFGLAADDGEEGFDLNALVDSFTGVTVGKTMSTLHVKLKGARFDTVGDIAPAFSNAEWTLNDEATLLSIRFLPDGEGVGVLLGDVLGDGSTNFFVSYTQGPVSLTFNSAIPEPATWALMIGGFGLVGSALRRRQPRTA